MEGAEKIGLLQKLDNTNDTNVSVEVDDASAVTDDNRIATNTVDDTKDKLRLCLNLSGIACQLLAGLLLTILGAVYVGQSCDQDIAVTLLLIGLCLTLAAPLEAMSVRMGYINLSGPVKASLFLLWVIIAICIFINLIQVLGIPEEGSVCPELLVKINFWIYGVIVLVGFGICCLAIIIFLCSAFWKLLKSKPGQTIDF